MRSHSTLKQLYEYITTLLTLVPDVFSVMCPEFQIRSLCQKKKQLI